MSPTPAREKRVLVVDDSSRMREAICETMRGLPGCVVVGQGAHGAQALELARALRPDLVVLDLHMPVMGGLEALRLLKSEMPCIPVVMVSTYLEPEVRQQARDLGAVACLEKGEELWRGLPTIVSALDDAPQAELA